MLMTLLGLMQLAKMFVLQVRAKTSNWLLSFARYLNIRMLRNPMLYGVPLGQIDADPLLKVRLCAWHSIQLLPYRMLLGGAGVTSPVVSPEASAASKLSGRLGERHVHEVAWTHAHLPQAFSLYAKAAGAAFLRNAACESCTRSVNEQGIWIVFLLR